MRNFGGFFAGLAKGFAQRALGRVITLSTQTRGGSHEHHYLIPKSPPRARTLLLTLAILLTAFSGQAAAQAIGNLTANLRVSEFGHPYDGLIVKFDCNYLREAVDAVKNEVAGKCAVEQIPPAGMKSSFFKGFVSVIIYFAHDNNLLVITPQPTRRTTLLFKDGIFAMIGSWHLYDGSTLPTTMTIEDTSGAQVTWLDPRVPTSFSDGNPAVQASQECLIYDFTGNVVHEG